MITSVHAEEVYDVETEQVEEPVFNDYSSAPLRTNWNQCTPQQLQEREQLQQTCRADFARRGLTEAVTPEEIVEARSCSSIESFGEVLGGCAKGFLLDVLGGLPAALLEFTARRRYAEQIEAACGAEPQNANYQSLLQGSAPLPEEQEEVNQFLRAQQTYRQCESQAIFTERSRRSMVRVQTERTIATYNERCRNEILSSAEASMRQRVHDCALTLASRDNCEACIDHMTRDRLEIPRTILRGIWDELRQYPSIQCFNRETQGRMICNALAAAYGGTVSQTVRRLPTALRERVAAAARGTADAVTNAALRARIRNAGFRLDENGLRLIRTADSPMASELGRLLEEYRLRLSPELAEEGADLFASNGMIQLQARHFSDPDATSSLIRNLRNDFGGFRRFPNDPNITNINGILTVTPSLSRSTLTAVERTIQGLNRRGITVRIDPNLDRGAYVASTSPNVIYVSTHALRNSTPNEFLGILTHEATHTTTFIRGAQAMTLPTATRRAYDGRNIRFNSSMGPNPAFPRGYDASFSADEIDALRRGATTDPTQAARLQEFHDIQQRIIPQISSLPDSNFTLGEIIMRPGQPFSGFQVRVSGLTADRLPVTLDVPVSLPINTPSEAVIEEARRILLHRFLRNSHLVPARPQ
ncbi:MAG: hypothetical protein HRT44_05125 [Bdellovibrionales bacterium]|nr:hypothetical protein [Bdellovibrionales bacterium]NQZ18624.1 hypothetical protein [Bdellovibrionales bacterium]